MGADSTSPAQALAAGHLMPGYWLFSLACGHPFGLHNAGPGVATERQAWNAFYDTEKQRRAAENRGVTCRYVDRDTYRAEYYPQMRDGCSCPPVLPPGRGICPECGREVRALKNGTIGPHTTGKRRQDWPYSSPRCTGWGQKPKEEA